MGIYSDTRSSMAAVLNPSECMFHRLPQMLRNIAQRAKSSPSLGSILCLTAPALKPSSTTEQGSSTVLLKGGVMSSAEDCLEHVARNNAVMPHGAYAALLIMRLDRTPGAPKTLKTLSHRS